MHSPFKSGYPLICLQNKNGEYFQEINLLKRENNGMLILVLRCKNYHFLLFAPF